MGFDGDAHTSFGKLKVFINPTSRVRYRPVVDAQESGNGGAVLGGWTAGLGCWGRPRPGVTVAMEVTSPTGDALPIEGTLLMRVALAMGLAGPPAGLHRGGGQDTNIARTREFAHFSYPLFLTASAESPAIRTPRPSSHSLLRS